MLFMDSNRNMKTRNKAMETVPVQDSLSKKLACANSEIQVLAGEIPSDLGENCVWPASGEDICLPDSAWLENGSPLTLVGNRHSISCTPTKWESSAISVSSSRITRQLKENLPVTPVKSRKVSPLKCSLTVCPSPTSNPKLNNDSLQSSVSTPPRLKDATADSLLLFNRKIPNQMRSPSPVKHITASPTKCSESWQILQQVKYVSSEMSVPSPTEGAVAPDTSGSTAATYPSPDSTTTKCSLKNPTIINLYANGGIGAKKNCDRASRSVPKRVLRRPKARVKKPGSREMRQLYVSLKEIPWAQHWSPNTFLGSKKQRYACRANRNVLAAKLDKDDTNKPSSIYAKFYPPKKDAKNAKSVATKNEKAVDIIPKKNVIRRLSSEQVTEENIPTVGDQVVSSTELANTQKENGQLSIKKYMKKEFEKGKNVVPVTVPVPVIKKPIQLHMLHKPILVSKATAVKLEMAAKNQLIKVEGLKVVDTEAQRTKSSAVRFDFVAKSKKAQVMADQKAPVENKILVSAPLLSPDDIKKENCGIDKPKVLKTLDKSCFTKGKCTVKCNDNTGQKCSEEGNCNVHSIAMLGTLFKRKDSRKRKFEEDMLRSSVRQSECAFRYKEIAVKKHHNYIQIILVPSVIRRNTLSLEALRELKEAFLAAQKDPTCKVVLLNSSGKYFCTGVDLSPLLGPDKDKAATVLADTLKSLVETLALFSKPLVAAVNGKALGFGVTLLPFCDVVLASDKATFYTPYAKLGYIPEAAATLTMPQVMGSTWAMNMLLRSQQLTAIQAHNCGLVTEVLWPSQFMEEVVPRVQEMASQSLQVMEATKVMMRCHQWEKLQAVLQTESRLLSKQWLTPQCQKSIREMMDRSLQGT